MVPVTWTHLGQTARVWPGRNWPLGATWTPERTNFAVYAPAATEVTLCLFTDAPDGGEEEHRFVLTEQSLGIWHGALPDVEPGTRYGYRVDGPWDPAAGHRFNPHKLLLDPYAMAVSGDFIPEPATFGYVFGSPEEQSTEDSAPHVPRSVVVDPASGDFDWEGDQPMRRRWRDTVVYECHVKGMTQLHDRVPQHLRGTYAGLGSPAVTDYLRDLGVTAVELLPVHQFVSEPGLTERGTSNYWGYNSIGYFAPHAAYSSSGDRGEQVREFKEMVKALHRAGLEVILDVVYNHTAEAGPLGPTLSFRGLDDRGFYKRVIPEPDPKTGAVEFDDTYWDVTGCGNTVDSNHPLALRLILDSLRYWVTEMHVDGFRFDLAAALAREFYDVDRLATFFELVQQDPVVSQVKLIAEPWDVGPGGYQVGGFPPQWTEWNGKYRDSVRDFWRGEPTLGELASRLAGSSDLYEQSGRLPFASINFVTAHDGFTLRDLVSYDEKHNDANGEDGNDGESHNRSWNHGVEGPTDDAEVLRMRARTQRNMIATLLLSQGVPMLLHGDEGGRTQGGNNNTYCQDNEISWMHWDDLDRPLVEFTAAVSRLRAEHPTFRRKRFFTGSTVRTGPEGAERLNDIVWLHPDGRPMEESDWDGDGRVLGMYLNGHGIQGMDERGGPIVDDHFCLFFNAGSDDVPLVLPPEEYAGRWAAVIDTAGGTDPETALLAGTELKLPGRSVLVLQEWAEPDPEVDWSVDASLREQAGRGTS